MRQINFYQLIIVTITASLFCSCWPMQQTPYYIPERRQKENKYYVPSAANAPLLGKKNEMRFNVSHVMGTEYRAVDLDAAYVISNHLGIAANLSEPTRRGDVQFPRAELSVGCLLPLKNNWHFETYAGGGTGKIKNFHATGTSSIRWNQYFIQPALAISNANQTLQLGFVSRFTKANFNLLDTSFSNDREVMPQINWLDYQSNQTTFFGSPVSHCDWGQERFSSIAISAILCN